MIEQAVQVVGHHFIAQRVFGVNRFALGATISQYYLVFFSKIRYLEKKVIDRTTVSMDDQKWLTLTVRFVIHFKTTDICIFTHCGITAVMCGIKAFFKVLCEKGLGCQCKQGYQQELFYFHGLSDIESKVVLFRAILMIRYLLRILNDFIQYFIRILLINSEEGSSSPASASAKPSSMVAF